MLARARESSTVSPGLFWLAAGLALLLTLTGTSLWLDQLLVTFLHEASHGLMTVLTGGQIVRFSIEPSTAGVCWNSGGFRPLVLVAGYAGGCTCGGAMLVAARSRYNLARPLLLALGAFMAGFTVLFGSTFFTWLVGLGWGAFFVWAALKGRGWHLALLLSFLAVRNSINALVDLRSLLWISRAGGVETDASLMSQELTHGFVPPLVFALVIALVSALLLAGFAYLAFRPRGRVSREPSALDA